MTLHFVVRYKTNQFRRVAQRQCRIGEVRQGLISTIALKRTLPVHMLVDVVLVGDDGPASAVL